MARAHAKKQTEGFNLFVDGALIQEPLFATRAAARGFRDTHFPGQPVRVERVRLRADYGIARDLYFRELLKEKKDPKLARKLADSAAGRPAA